MLDSIRPWLLLVAWFASFGAGLRYLASANEPPRPVSRLVWLATLAITAATSVLYLRNPAAASVMERVPEQVVAGEWWRLLIALGGQDGGVAGAVSNLLGLALIGGVAARLWSPERWLAQYFGAGLIAALGAVLWLNQPGAGNSIAVCGLAAGLAAQLALVYIRPVRILAGISLAAGLILLATGDLHGVAFGAGLVLATRFAQSRR